MLFTELLLKKSKHIPYSLQIAESICNEYSICFSSQNLPYGGASDFVLRGSSPYNPKNNKNEEHSKEHSSFLVRWKGLRRNTLRV